ncbi:tRNA lysidine(34) synthetase TilS [Planctomycetota bacterium]|nr:tRNA lysidine(34) synthetase TilS [Planctomycetota bacterium]
MDFKNSTKLSYHPLVRAVARNLKTIPTLKSSNNTSLQILIATSGGADSVALLLALNLLNQKRTYNLNLTVAHIQHHLRGDDAEADAQFVQSLALKLNLPFIRKDIDLSSAKNIENDARRMRYDALTQIAQDINCPFIATAHHADDQLETILMRMLRGTASKGLRGIAKTRSIASNIKLIRPMLTVKREDVIDFLNTADQPWREDHTNADVDRWRSKLRHEVLPVLKEIREDAALKAVQLSNVMRDLDSVLKDQIQQVRSDSVQVIGQGDYHMIRQDLRDQRKPVLIGLLKELVTSLGVDTDRSGEKELGPIVKAIKDNQGGKRIFQLNASIEVQVTREEVLVQKTSSS